MSHLLSFKTQVTDRNALVRALERMGFKGKIEVHDKAVAMNSYDGSRNMANVIVRKKDNGSLSDIGFQQTADGTFSTYLDEWNMGGVCYNKAWQNKLYTYYNVEKSKIEFENKGLAYTESKDDIGRIKLEVKFITKTEPGKLTVNL